MLLHKLAHETAQLFNLQTFTSGLHMLQGQLANTSGFGYSMMTPNCECRCFL